MEEQREKGKFSDRPRYIILELNNVLIQFDSPQVKQTLISTIANVAARVKNN